MVLGLYYLTKAKKGAKGEGRRFANTEEILMAPRSQGSRDAFAHPAALHG